jgi:hypothetical protein
MDNELNENAYNICMLIPSFVDYLFPIGAANYIKSGESREFPNLILYSP